MKHLDLFSGIGGFALATEMVWDNVEHVFCDNEPFSQVVLKKHWPNATIYGDIRTLTADTEHKRLQGSGNNEYRELQKPAEDTRQTERIDLLTGGFPCQPFSQAGRRKGTQDDRFLWPEMLRVIREFRPRWVVAENVAGLLTIERGVVFEQVCADLEGEGYAVQAFVIPVVAVNAPHRRDRVWIVAYHGDGNSQQWRDSSCGRSKSPYSWEKTSSPSALGRRGDGRRIKTRKSKKSNNIQDAPDPTSTRRQQRRQGGRNKTWIEERIFGRDSWNQNWFEVATRLCRMDDGLRNWVDGRGKIRNSRNNRLKALGNAIVPQVAAEIFKAIKEVDTTPRTP